MITIPIRGEVIQQLRTDTVNFMSTRREALCTIAAVATFPALGAPRTASKHFSAEDFQLLTAVVDLIIPRTDTPGAFDAGVPLYIDRVAGNKPTVRRTLQEGLAALRAEGFEKATPERRLELLTSASRPFLELAKELTIDGYYSTREGLVTELGYHGNTYVREFTGCTHPEHQAALGQATQDAD